jgi:hypothetical protein
MERGNRQGKEMGEGIYYKKRKIPCLCFGEDTDRGENEKKHRKCLLEWLLSKVEETV